MSKKIVSQIKAPIIEEMELFEKKFKGSMESPVPLLDRVTHYIIKRKGKQMRPMFVFLSSKMLGDVHESSYTAASLIELLHTATLVHDDVVDDAYERRGFFSVNAIWKNKIAVLVGDYLLSRGLLLSVDKKEYKALEIVSTAVRSMSEGELLQIEKARKLDIDEEVYYDVIKKKTASLIASCCAAGANAADKSDEVVEKMRLFGEYTGMAFQLKDDIFDYGTADKIGKPTGNDIRERKMTLPLIYAIRNSEKKVSRKLINIVKKHNENSKKVKKAVEIVIDSGGIAYTEKVMNEYKAKALEILHSFPKNKSRDALELMVEYTTTREK